MDTFLTITIALFAVGLILLGVGSTATARRERLRTDVHLQTLDRKLDAVIAHLGVQLPEPQYPEVVALIRDQKQIEAVRLYRDRTGADLLTAKNAVDALAARLDL